MSVVPTNSDTVLAYDGCTTHRLSAHANYISIILYNVTSLGMHIPTYSWPTSFPQGQLTTVLDRSKISLNIAMTVYVHNRPIKITIRAWFEGLRTAAVYIATSPSGVRPTRHQAGGTPIREQGTKGTCVLHDFVKVPACTARRCELWTIIRSHGNDG